MHISFANASKTSFETLTMEREVSIMFNTVLATLFVPSINYSTEFVADLVSINIRSFEDKYVRTRSNQVSVTTLQSVLCMKNTQFPKKSFRSDPCSITKCKTNLLYKVIKICVFYLRFNVVKFSCLFRMKLSAFAIELKCNLMNSCTLRLLPLLFGKVI